MRPFGNRIRWAICTLRGHRQPYEQARVRPKGAAKAETLEVCGRCLRVMGVVEYRGQYPLPR